MPANANQVVGQVAVKVVPDGSQFGPQLQALLNRAGQQATAAGATIQQALSQAAGGTQQLGQAIDSNIGQKFAMAAVEAARFTAAIYATRAAVEGTIGKLAGLFDQLTKAQAGFSAILGPRSGSGLLEEVRQFAKETPFNTSEIIQYSQQLLGVGVSANKIIPLLQNTGDIIASVGGDTQNLSRVLFTLTQIQTVGRLVGQDAMQLQSALIPITKYLSSYLNKTTAEVKKLQEQGAISAETVFAAISAQGEKVAGAMAASVRTIQGAREVLNDTILITFQDSKALEGIYQDIVGAFIKMSEILSDPAVQATIQRTLQGVGDVYTELKPVITGIVSSLGTLAESGLGTLGTTLNIISTAIGAIPVGALEVIGNVLAVMATLKAPLALLSYVKNLSSMASLLPKVVGNLSKATAATEMNGQASLVAAEKIQVETTALQRRNAAIQKWAGIAAVVGAGVAGQYLQGKDKTDTTAQTAGGALTYGAMGAAVGGAPGAVIGASLGALVGYLGAEEEKARVHVEKMKKLGTESAEGFIRAGGEAFETANAVSGTALEGELDRLTRKQKALAAERKKAMDSAPDPSLIEKINANVNPISYLLGDADKIDEAADAAKRAALVNADALSTLGGELETTKAAYDALFAPVEETLRGILPLLGDASGKVRALFFTGEGRQSAQVVKSWDEVEKAAEKYGLTLNDLGTLGTEAVAKIINKMEALPDATKDAIIAANLLSAAYEQAGKDAAILYENIIKNKQVTLGTITSADSAVSAGVTASLNPTSQTAGIQASIALDQAKQAATKEKLAQLRIQESNQMANLAGLEGAERARAIDRIKELQLEAEALIQVNAGKEAQLDIEKRIAAEVARQAPLQKIGNRLSNETAIDTAQAAAIKARLDLTNKELQLEAQRATLIAQNTAGALAEAEVLRTGISWIDKATLAHAREGAAAETANRVTLAANQAAAAANARTSAITETRIGQLLRLAGVADTLENRVLAIDVVTTGIQAALDELARVAEYINRIQNGDYGAPGSPSRATDANAAKRAAERADEELQALKNGDTAALKPLADKIGEAVAFRDLKGPEKGNDDAKRAAEELARKMEQATNTLIQGVESAMQAVTQAAEAWKSSIKETVEYERAVSTGRAIRNTTRQISDIKELTSGIEALKARGLSEAAISALGIDSITDTRQVRKLVRSDPAQLAALSAAVAERDRLATTLASSREDERTRKNITTAIVEAAKILDIKLTPEQANAIQVNADINILATDPVVAADQFLTAIKGGKITT